MNRFRLALFIVLVSLIYTTPRAPKGRATDKAGPQSQTQVSKENKRKLQWPAVGVLPSDTNLYSRYQQDTIGLTLPADRVQDQNAQVFANLHSLQPSLKPNRLSEISFGQAKEVLDFTMKHPVVGMDQLKKYDPEGCLGFCFGRAMFIHLELLARGVNKDSIRKAYVVGQMNYNDITWQFHVATAVRGNNGQWFVIDPEFDKVESIEDWFAGNLELSTDKQLRLYMTDADKFGASSPGYQAAELNNQKWYRTYFVDALKSFRDRKRDVAQMNRFIDHRLCENVFD